MDVLGVKGAERREFVKAAGMLPDLEVSASPTQEGATGNPQGGQLKVVLDRKNNLPNPEGKIYAPRFPKPQTEGYFVLVTGASGDLLALKRAGWPSADQRGGRSANQRGRGGKQAPINSDTHGGKAAFTTTVKLNLSPLKPREQWMCWL